MQNLWNRFQHWCVTTWHQLDNWQTALLFVLVALAIYSPVWGGYLLYFLFHWKWALWMATGVLAFWAGPFTPFFPLVMAITLGIKKIWIRFHRKVQTKIHGLSPSSKDLPASKTVPQSSGGKPEKPDKS